MAFERGKRSPESVASGLNASVRKVGSHTWKPARDLSQLSHLSYDFRVRLLLLAFAMPSLGFAGMLVWRQTGSVHLTLAAVSALMLMLLLASVILLRTLTRPLQTLANVVSALRDGDFSLRARSARHGSSLGDLASEVNQLADTLQAQMSTARDALTVAERVMGAMRTPVLAFAPDATLRLLNPAAEAAFRFVRAQVLGQSAVSLGLGSLFALKDSAVYTNPEVSGIAGEIRWSLHRSTFRLGGLPHELFVLSDVDAALREEERIAWQRLIRVLSHEINNSLTPITSIAGSLRLRVSHDAGLNQTEHVLDLRRGLQLIEERSRSLHQFLEAYQEFTHLPKPRLQRVSIPELMQRVANLETRLRVQLMPGPDASLLLDPQQIEHLLINLVRNAAEAALGVSPPQLLPLVNLMWSLQGKELTIRVEDNGPGLTNPANLFVPFYTTKADGTGIGLALAKQIAVGHNGTLTLTNKDDLSGCVAELRLPTLAHAGTRA